jgi:hypothetical protein
MTECLLAGDYGAICAAEHTIGTASERQHWALPHHYLSSPGKAGPPNQDGVTAGLSRLSQTKNISPAELSKGQTHLEDHMKVINPDYTPANKEAPSLATARREIAAAFVDIEVKHMAGPSHVQAAHDALVRAGAKCMLAGDSVKSVEDVAAYRRRMKLLAAKTAARIS